jgi:hypothetical protein
MVDERHKQPGSNVNPTTAKTNMYLGYLCPFEEFHVYGYVTNTHIKVGVFGTGLYSVELFIYIYNIR